jgi:tryptophan 2,3-dioxygenase
MPEKAQNKHGCIPPLGCKPLYYGKDHPRVAVGSEICSFEAAFLTDKLYDDFAHAVDSCATLKAWFALKLRMQETKDELSKQGCLVDIQFKSHDWRRVWNMIQDKEPAWAEQYKRPGPESNLWELPKPASALEERESSTTSIVLY